MHEVSSLSAWNNSHFTRLKWICGALWPLSPISLFLRLLVTQLLICGGTLTQKMGFVLHRYYLPVSQVVIYELQHYRGSNAVMSLQGDWQLMTNIRDHRMKMNCTACVLGHLWSVFVAVPCTVTLPMNRNTDEISYWTQPRFTWT